MKKFIKYLSVVLIILLSFSFLSCKSTTQRLDRIEKGYSQEFREYLETLGDEEYLTKLAKDNEQIESL